jgi:hypothetical protein
MTGHRSEACRIGSVVLVCIPLGDLQQRLLVLGLKGHDPRVCQEQVVGIPFTSIPSLGPETALHLPTEDTTM